MDSDSLAAEIRAAARTLGFDLVGICPAVEPAGISRFAAWLSAGYAGEMHYLPDRQEAYAHPQHVLDGARSIVMLGMHYRTADPACLQPGEGRVARYAWGGDYHDLIRARLNQLADRVRLLAPQSSVRGVVDTAPLLEREFAQLAGIGWIGKNTLLINKQTGSWFLLAALLTDLELPYDAAHEQDHCGTCRACLDACPTGAFVDAWQLDARKCISYLTIELRNPIDPALRSGVGEWLFGCDVCQEVCPWNHRAPESTEPAFAAREGMNPIDLVALFDLDDAAFRARFRGSPLWRPKRRGLLRNAAIVLGNQAAAGQGTPAALTALLRGLADNELLVRGTAAWALGQYQEPVARDALWSRLQIESDAEVIAELNAALYPGSSTTSTRIAL